MRALCVVWAILVAGILPARAQVGASPTTAGFYYYITNAAATAGYDVSSLTNTTSTFKEAVNAYFWGYPLEEMWRTQQLVPNTYGFQVNQLFAPGTINNSTTVVAPNMNVLNATGFLDLSGNNAFVLSVPNTTSSGTYNIMQMLNAYTDVTYSFGTRNFQTGAVNNTGGNYLLVGPGYNASTALPANITAVVTNATAQAWMIGRVQVDPYVTNTLNGSATPYNTLAGGTTNVFSPDNSKAIVQSYGLTPLNDFLNGTTNLPVTSASPTSSQQATAAANASAMTGQAFYQYVGTNVAYSGLNAVAGQTNNQAAMYSTFSGIGYGTNGYTAPNAATQSVMNLAASNAAAMLTQMGNNTSLLNPGNTTSTGWVVNTTLGSYTNTYNGWLTAAVTAKVGLGANLAADATYPQTTVDSAGNALNGGSAYTMTFAPGNMPPAEGFWSLTVYDLNGNVVPNTGNTFYGDNVFSISSMQMMNVLGANYDQSSVSLLLQSQAPTDSALMPYWLPTPAGQDFELVLRMYLPDGTSSSSSILNGTYTVPGVELVPEPGSGALLVVGMGVLVAVRQRRRRTARYGMVASSKGARLKPDAIDVRVMVDPVHWFLNDQEDTRASMYLEDAATEFDVQGLELDWALVAWDGDWPPRTRPRPSMPPPPAILGAAYAEGFAVQGRRALPSENVTESETATFIKSGLPAWELELTGMSGKE